MTTVRIGTRKSKLAMVQARLVAEGIERHHPEVRCEVVGYTTAGDVILDRPLEEVGGKGLFVQELDRALIEGRIDLAVHSYKDLPAELSPGVEVVACSPREDPRDAIVLPAGADLLPDGADDALLAERLLATGLPVGCSSARRRVQLGELLGPEVRVESVRGSVPTRLAKLDGGGYCALVLAVAGLRRLGLEGRASRVLGPDEMVPAAGQGAMAVCGRAGEERPELVGYDDPATHLCVRAERAFARALGATCASPVGAYARMTGDGALRLSVFCGGRDEVVCAPEDAEEEAAHLGREVRDCAWLPCD